MSAKSIVGKYVCYGNEDGGFCWGKIASCTSMNTIKGPMEAFVLEGRMSCREKGGRITRHEKPTLLRADKFDREIDVVDSTGGLGDLDDETLFRASMGDVGSIRLGLRNMAQAKSEVGVADMAAAVLKDRMGID